MIGAITVVWAREPISVSGPSVFLAGPTPRARCRLWWRPSTWRPSVASWRPAALAELTVAWTGSDQLTVLTPESRGGVRAQHYDDQFQWETAARAAATCVLFWIPRDVTELPGFTTNVEFGHDVSSGRAVLGCPPNCPNPERNRYVIHLARRYGVPVTETLPSAVAAALKLIASLNTAATAPAGSPPLSRAMR